MNNSFSFADPRQSSHISKPHTPAKPVLDQSANDISLGFRSEIHKSIPLFRSEEHQAINEQILTPSRQPPKLDVTQSDVKRNLEEKLDQPSFTVIGAVMSTMQAIRSALVGNKSAFEDESEADYLKDYMQMNGFIQPEELTVR
jgi:hypothetical protein